MTSKEYRGHDFYLRIENVFREAMAIFYVSQGSELKFGGELCGTNCDELQILIPEEIESGRARRIAEDLATGLRALGYGYVIARRMGTDVVPASDQKGAAAELGEMGFELSVSSDRKEIRLKRKPGAPERDIETVRGAAARMKDLLQAVHGTRPHLEILAKSSKS